MEIERKFLIDKFPDLPHNQELRMEQGYLSTEPEVRIRKAQNRETEYYVLTIKGDGDLARAEINLCISKDAYEDIKSFIGKDFIQRTFREYAIDNDLLLECSIIDEDLPTSFMYAEMEFSSIEEAKAFAPPGYLGKEVTYDPSYRMKNYWKRRHSQ